MTQIQNKNITMEMRLIPCIIRNDEVLGRDGSGF